MDISHKKKMEICDEAYTTLKNKIKLIEYNETYYEENEFCGQEMNEYINGERKKNKIKIKILKNIMNTTNEINEYNIQNTAFEQFKNMSLYDKDEFYRIINLNENFLKKEITKNENEIEIYKKILNLKNKYNKKEKLDLIFSKLNKRKDILSQILKIKLSNDGTSEIEPKMDIFQYGKNELQELKNEKQDISLSNTDQSKNTNKKEYEHFEVSNNKYFDKDDEKIKENDSNEKYKELIQNTNMEMKETNIEDKKMSSEYKNEDFNDENSMNDSTDGHSEDEDLMNQINHIQPNNNNLESEENTTFDINKKTSRKNFDDIFPKEKSTELFSEDENYPDGADDTIIGEKENILKFHQKKTKDMIVREFIREILEETCDMIKINQKRLNVIKEMDMINMEIIKHYKKWKILFPNERILDTDKFEEEYLKRIETQIENDENYSFINNYQFADFKKLSDAIENKISLYENTDENNLKEVLMKKIRENEESMLRLKGYYDSKHKEFIKNNLLNKIEEDIYKLNWFNVYGFLIKGVYLNFKYY